MLVVAFGVVLLFTFSFNGWGWLFRKCLRLERGHWTTTVVLGLAATMFVGGLLNLLHVAYPAVLAGIICSGIVLSLISVKRDFGSFFGLCTAMIGKIRSESQYLIVVIAIIGGIMWFTIATQLTPRAFNFHDDFQKYFAHPTRMLQTGTLFGSPLCTLGSATLGGQAFLQGFILAYLPINYINGADAVFGLFLCLLLASQSTSGRNNLLEVTVFSLLCVVFINPQYVNVSSLYLGSALILGMITISTNPAEMSESSPSPHPGAMGLLYAAMLTCKSSFALFVALHLPAVAISLGLTDRNLRSSIRWLLKCALYLLFFLSPWLLLYRNYYFAGLTDAVPNSLQAGNEGAATLDLLSLAPHQYGSTMAHYTVLFIAIGIASAVVVCAARRSEKSVYQRALMTGAVGMTGVAGYFVMLFVFGPKLAGYEQSVRYFTFVPIAVAPAVFSLMIVILDQLDSFASRALRYCLFFVLAVVPTVAFFPTLIDRIDQAENSGSVLAFSRLAEAPQYLEYNHEVLQESGRKRVERQQDVVPAGVPFIAWINEPFYLNYARNPVYDVDTGGMLTSWARVPSVRYVIWEYRGYATMPRSQYEAYAMAPGAQVRLIAKHALAFGRDLSAVVAHGQRIFDDGRTAIFLLPEPSK